MALIGLVMVATMLVTPVLNNAATVLLMGPIAAGLATRLDLSVDPFLMAVAVGASSDFPADRASVEYTAGHGSRRLPFRRLLAAGPAGFPPGHRRRRTAHRPVLAAAVIHILRQA
ncbi:MAG: hypothetical protein M5U09_13295 [Gammaproteobacteria bacterium]|nr:hypothetical protein [Gammaproteobacteria bacterium]